MYYNRCSEQQREVCVYEVLRNILLSFASQVSASWMNRFHTVLPCFVTVLCTWRWKALKGRIINEIYLTRVKLLLPTCSSYIASAALLWGKKFPSKIGCNVLPRAALWPNNGPFFITQVLGVFNEFEVVEGLETMVRSSTTLGVPLDGTV